MTTARVALIALITLLPSCGSSGAPRACEVQSESGRVQLEDFVFRPSCLQAPPDGVIVLENTGDAPHTFTVERTDVDVNIDAGSSGEADLRTVDPGTYVVTCTFHPQMEATLTVG
jgi:plastocyanin